MPKLTDDPSIPLPDVADRFGELNVRRFESIIAAVVQRYPDPVSFKPISVKPITALSRLRDAVRAIVHPLSLITTSIDIDKLREIWPNINVRIEQDKVFIGTSLPSSPYLSENTPDAIDSLIFLDATNVQLFEAACICKHFDLFQFQITVINCTPELVNATQERWPNAVLIEGSSPGEYTII